MLSVPTQPEQGSTGAAPRLRTVTLKVRTINELLRDAEPKNIPSSQIVWPASKHLYPCRSAHRLLWSSCCPVRRLSRHPMQLFLASSFPSKPALWW